MWLLKLLLIINTLFKNKYINLNKKKHIIYNLKIKIYLYIIFKLKMDW